MSRSPKYPPRLRSVPAPTQPIIIDPPDGFSDDWLQGWQACREQLLDDHARNAERDAEYPRSVPADSGAVIVLGIGALSGFIVGFILALAIFA